MTHYTDLTNAQELVHRYGNHIRYVGQWGWMIWDGKRWVEDETDTITHFAKETVKGFITDAANMEDEDKCRQLLEHAIHSQQAYRIRATVELARSERCVVAEVKDFDSHPFLLTVNNGTIDLTTGELQPHNPNHLITKLAPVDYVPSATSLDVWNKFIQEITDNDTELQCYLQRSVGYSLTGDTREEVFFILYGTGRNGKSKFLEAIQNILGDYAQVTPSRTFMRKEGSIGPTNDIAALAGARLVTTVETESGKSLDLTTVKQITGGDRVSARRLYKEYFTFTPQLKLFMATNNKPTVSEDNIAVWERIKLIPFNVSFAGRADKQLSIKLKQAATAILTWAVQGCLKWQEKGLQEPESVKAATSDYKDEQDILADFITEKCTEDSKIEIRARELYKAYESWCMANGEKPISEKMFAGKMEEKGYKAIRISSGKVYKGIGKVEISSPYEYENDLVNAF